MDQSTFEVRLANWTSIIRSCQARPEGQTARLWLSENNVSEKKYYYWLRRVRIRALEQRANSLPAVIPAAFPLPGSV